MKKVLFCLSLIISLSVLGVVPSFASTVAIDPALIGDLGDLGYSLAGGGSYSFGDSYIQKKYFSEYESADEFMKRKVAEKAAEDFLTGYAISRGLPLPSNASDYVENLPTDTYGYFKSVYFDNQVNSITNKAKLAGNDAALLSDAMRFGIGPAAFATWADYSKFWYNKFTAIGETSDTPVPSPDLDYISYINTANADQAYGFFWGDMPATYSGSYTYHVNTIPAYNYSWFRMSGNNQIGTVNYSSTNGWQLSNGISPATTILTLNIISNLDGTFTGTIDNFAMYEYVGYRSGANYKSVSIKYNGLDDFNSYNFATSSASISNTSWTYSDSTLAAVLNWFCNRFKNINIYVDGELWALGGSIDDAPANPIIPEFPDVIDPTSDDPAYTIDLPATDTGEGYFDITSLFDALVDAIEGALDDDPTTDGVLDGTRGLEFEDEAGEAVNDDPIPDDDVIDDSIPDPTGFPNIPVPLPPIQDAFSGTTVLAELVHATDIVMPDELMAVFWGILFILFIIGLIKILHK